MDYEKVLPQSLIVFFLLWSTIEGSDKASPFIPDQIPLSIHIDNTNKLYNFLVWEYALSPSLYKKRFFPYTSQITYTGKQPASDIVCRSLDRQSLGRTVKQDW